MAGTRGIFYGWLFLGLIVFSGCANQSTPEDPREVVIQLFGAMERNERAALPNLLDLGKLMQSGSEDYALQTNIPRRFFNPEEILNDLTDSGLTKTRWFSMQRILGSSEVRGDSAWVEVSFINKEQGIQYYNKFGLHRLKGRWKIYSFKTISR